MELGVAGVKRSLKTLVPGCSLRRTSLRCQVDDASEIHACNKDNTKGMWYCLYHDRYVGIKGCMGDSLIRSLLGWSSDGGWNAGKERL